MERNRKILTVSSIAILIVLFLSFYFVHSEILLRADLRILDQFFQIRGPVDPGSDIVIVALDSDSRQRMKRKTWQRADFARAIEALTAAGAELIALDVLFTVPDPDPSQDEALLTALRDSANVILASDISRDNPAVPLPSFREQEVAEGFLNFLPDEDGSVRSIPPPYLKTSGQDYVSDLPFSVQIAVSRLYPEGDIKTDLKQEGSLILGDLQIPYSGTKATAGFFINFTGPAGHFKSIPFYKVLGNHLNSGDVRSKIVLIGSMNPAQHDYFKVSIRPNAKQESTIQSMYGVEIHANAIHTLLHRRFIRPLQPLTLSIVLGIASLLAIWLAIGVRWNVFLVFGCLLFFLFGMWTACYILFLRGIFIAASPVYFSVIAVGLIGLVTRQAEESAERRYVTQLFGRYVAPNVVQELITNRDLLQLSGRKQRLTIFFSDIRGFTSMSEKMQPEQVSTLLNEYFSNMTRIVFKHSGTLDKFIGDSVMAFFGNPVYFENHAERAVLMALEMKEEMERLKSKWKSQGKEHSFEIGMGINTGEVIVGNLGSTDFFDYTVIGDEVNLACRIESVAKGAQILISTATYEEVKDKFEVARLEPVQLKGKSQPVQIYEVIKRR